MERAFLSLYGATADRHWLARAIAAMAFIDANFKDATGAGFDSSKAPTDKAYATHPERDENVAVARAANLLSQFTGNAADKKIAEQAMRYVAADPIVYRLPAASPLLADWELSTAPLHLTVVGARADAKSKQLFQQALQYPASYKRLEWWDPAEGPAGRLPNPDVQYPPLRSPAAFVCTNRTCSPPIYDPEKLQARIDKLLAAAAPSRTAQNDRP
jgi:uncharacterized protein YyaL (SSP411 family)